MSELIESNTMPVNEPQYTFETLPDLLPQQQRMVNFILEGDNYIDAYRKAGYSSEYAKQAAHVLVTRNPIKAYLDYFSNELAKMITPATIKVRLQHIVDRALIDDKQLETGIKAIDIINKMQGNYAQTNQTNIQINTSIEDIRNAKAEYIKDK